VTIVSSSPTSENATERIEIMNDVKGVTWAISKQAFYSLCLVAVLVFCFVVVIVLVPIDVFGL
jgi:hypothetical protein